MHWRALHVRRVFVWRHCYSPVLLAIALGIGFSFGVFGAVRWWESKTIEKAFRSAAEDRATAVKSSFEIELAMLELVRSALITDGRIERQEFKEILAPFHSHGRSVEAVEWIPRVLQCQRKEFEAAARRDGLAGFRITELDRNGRLVEAGTRSDYFPVFYIGPGSGDPSVYGYDIASESTRLESLQLARDSGRTVASGRIAFVQNAQTMNGFLVYLPTYQKDKPTRNVAERRENLHGFVLGVFRPNEMLRSALARLQPEGIDVCLFDLSACDSDRRFYSHASRMRTLATQPLNSDGSMQKAKMSLTVPLDVAGHRWTIECTPTADFAAARRSWWPWGVLATGLLLTTVLARYLASSIEHRASVEKLLTEKRRYACELEAKVMEQTADIRQAQEEVIYRLVSASQWRDEETGMHIRRTGLLSEALALAAGWSASEAEILRQAAPMHDVGKIGIPDAILQKPGKLTPAEFEIMKTHTLIGAKMLADSNVPILHMARDIALNHHERWDGRGYPNGKAGQDIPECARILAIVDVYDALVHDRVYRRAMPEEKVLAILKREAGAHFDPLLVTHFFVILDRIRQLTAEHPDAPMGEDPVAAMDGLLALTAPVEEMIDAV